MPKAKSLPSYELAERESRSIRAYLVSDHKLLIDAFIDLMRNRRDILIAGSITIQGLSQGTFSKLPSVDVFLVDSTMKTSDAIEVTRTLNQRFSESKIVILGLEHNEEQILKFVEAGAVGYVLQQASLDEMCGTITAIHNGQSPCSSRVVASLFHKMAQLARLQREATVEHHVSLTDREKEILQLMSVGLNNKDIARYLDIAFHTVKNHSHNILKKMQVHSRRDAIGLAYKRGIIDKTIHSSLGLLLGVVMPVGPYVGLDIASLVDCFISRL